ncbi:hypothetical protein ACEV6Q_04345 [Enterobacter ludwigii]|uniref:hypothetical protein n=1 Tax=Enterobacter ludwigii TaxID=299767 RepID=UPI003BEF4606
MNINTGLSAGVCHKLWLFIDTLSVAVVFCFVVCLAASLAGCVTVSVHQQTGDEALRSTQLQTTKHEIANSETHLNKQTLLVGAAKAVEATVMHREANNEKKTN